MAKRIYNIICAYCNKPAQKANPKAKYCSGGCRVMAHKVRNNIPIPDFRVKQIIGRIPRKSEIEISNRIKELDELTKYLNDKKNELEIKLNEECEKIDDLIKSYSILKYSYSEDFKVIKETQYHTSSSERLNQKYQNKNKFQAEINEIWKLLYDVDSKEKYSSIDFSLRIEYAKVVKNHYIDKFTTQKNDIKKKYDETYTQIYIESNLRIEVLEKELMHLQKGYNIEEMLESGGIKDMKDIINMDYDLYNLSNPFKNVLGSPEKCFVAMIHGSQGSGKSIFSLQLANEFLKYGEVIYYSIEEGCSYSFKTKLEKYIYNVLSDKLKISTERTAASISKSSKNFALAIIDSVTDASLTVDDIKDILKDRRINKTSFLLIMQETKGGVYKGDAEIGHLVDIQLKAENGLVTVEKNRYILGPESKEYVVFVEN